MANIVFGNLFFSDKGSLRLALMQNWALILVKVNPMVALSLKPS